MSQFGKSYWAYFSRRYFLTKSFKYTIKAWRGIVMLNTFVFGFLLFGIFSVVGLLHDAQDLLNWLPTIFAFIPLAFGTYFFFKYHRHLRRHLTISRGNDVFIFGEDEDENKAYNKADITKIIHYKSSNPKANQIEYYDIQFKDNTAIRFSNILIADFEAKFLSSWKFTSTIIYCNTWAMCDIIINEIDEQRFKHIINIEITPFFKIKFCSPTNIHKK